MYGFHHYRIVGMVFGMVKHYLRATRSTRDLKVEGTEDDQQYDYSVRLTTTASFIPSSCLPRVLHSTHFTLLDDDDAWREKIKRQQRTQAKRTMCILRPRQASVQPPWIIIIAAGAQAHPSSEPLMHLRIHGQP